MVVYAERFSFVLRISGALTIGAVFVCGIPLIASIWSNYSYSIALGLCASLGFVAAILQASTVGFSNLLPESYTRSTISGQAVSGILVSIIYILVKLFEPNNKAGIFEGGWIYFITGASGNILVAIAFYYIFYYSNFVKYHLKTYFKIWDSKYNKKAKNKNKNKAGENDKNNTDRKTKHKKSFTVSTTLNEVCF